MTFPTSTHVGRLYVESRHRPATQGGGGDIYDVMATPFGVRLLVGDVMGHGPQAACTSAEVMKAFRDLASRPDPVQDIAAGLHEFLTARPRRSPSGAGPANDGDDRDISEEYVTAVIISVPWDAGAEAQIVNCGHPAPLLLDGGGMLCSPPVGGTPQGSATLLDAIPLAPPLGLLDLADGPACPAPLRLAPGASLLLYTDGVTEARDGQGRLYPLPERAAALASQQPARRPAFRHAEDRLTLLQAIQADLLRHTGGTLADDTTMLLVILDDKPSRSLIPPVPEVGAFHRRLSEAADCQGSFLV